MKELILGKISTQELADWFGLAYSTFRKKKKMLMPELNYFCTYTSYYGGVEVSEIYYKVYNKDLRTQDAETYLQLVKEANDNLCSLTGMACKLQFLYPDTWGKYSESQIRNRLRKVGKAMFGDTNFPSKPEERSNGPMGYREYCWAIKEGDFNEYRFLTEEEDKIFDNLLNSYHVSSKDIALKEIVDKELKNKLLEGSISKEEYVAASSQIEFFPQLLSKFKKLTGKTLAHATYHDVLESAF